MKRPRLWAALIVVGALLFGAIAGGAVTTWVIARRIASLFEGPPAEVNARLYGFELQRRLHLTDDQRKQIERVVQEDHEANAAILRSVEPQLGELRTRRHDRLRELIPAEKRPEFDQMRARFERRYREGIGLSQ